MFSPFVVLLFLACYASGLFLLARWAERRSEAGRPVTDNPWVYALSLATYCTSWTFYGSVGKSLDSGLLFLTIYLGPTLCAALWWSILRKLVRIKSSFHITSIADLLAARYGKSHRIAALATTVAFVGSVPYVALQLKSVISTFSLVSGGRLDRRSPRPECRPYTANRPTPPRATSLISASAVMVATMPGWRSVGSMRRTPSRMV